MLKLENRFDEYSYRVANFDLDPTVTSLKEGQWVTITGGKLTIADGTKKAFIATGSHRAGRDQVAGIPVKKIAILVGTFILTTDQFNTGGTYTDMTPLMVTTGGILTPVVTPATDRCVAYAVGAPVNGFIRIISA